MPNVDRHARPAYSQVLIDRPQSQFGHHLVQFPPLADKPLHGRIDHLVNAYSVPSDPAAPLEGLLIGSGQDDARIAAKHQIAGSKTNALAGEVSIELMSASSDIDPLHRLMPCSVIRSPAVCASIRLYNSSKLISQAFSSVRRRPYKSNASFCVCVSWSRWPTTSALGTVDRDFDNRNRLPISSCKRYSWPTAIASLVRYLASRSAPRGARPEVIDSSSALRRRSRPRLALGRAYPPPQAPPRTFRPSGLLHFCSAQRE